MATPLVRKPNLSCLVGVGGMAEPPMSTEENAGWRQTLPRARWAYFWAMDLDRSYFTIFLLIPLANILLHVKNA